MGCVTAGLAEPHGTEVLGYDPRKNAWLKAGNKNDRIDVRKPADLLRTGESHSLRVVRQNFSPICVLMRIDLGH
jgi:hypothetical protein